MRLEEMLHQQWLTDETLSALLPGERVTTGWSQASTRLPRAVVNCRRRRRAWLDSTYRQADRVWVDVRIWSTAHPELLTLLERVAALFDGRSFELGDDARVLRMTRVGERVVRQPDGLWRGELVLSALVVRP